MTQTLEKLIAANEALKQEIAKSIERQARSEIVARIPEESPDPVMRVTEDAALIYANGSAGGLLRTWAIDTGDRLPADWARAVHDTVAHRAMVEHDLECGERTFALTLQPASDHTHVNIYCRDITRLKKAEAQIVNFDDLTGLPNRALFQDRLRQVLGHARRTGKMAAVHVVDLDRFKEINDTLGHDAGDEVLRTIGERMEACVRTSDTVARLGSDEFGVIQVEPTDADGVAILAQKLLDCVEQPITISDRSVHVDASIGITIYPEDSTSPEEALRNADLALSYGKDDGRGSYRFFVAQMQEDMQRRRAIEEDMRAGLKRGEFVLHYQPKMRVPSGRVTGMEALVRWQHPEQGFMSPAEFIPIAERSRLIVPLSEWVLREACRRNKAWNDSGLGPVKVAVNVSAVQFRETRLPDVVAGVLDETGLAAELLELEITESLAMRDAEATIELFNELKELGVSLSIDDFGTGYSSLSYLKRFPVQRIKIDKAFVDDIDGADNAGAIAKAVTIMGHSFGMEITAEGVEEDHQLRFLHGLGCEEIQGYLFSRPLAADDFEAFMIEHLNGTASENAAAGHANG